jgi:hypothetical protein
MKLQAYISFHIPILFTSKFRILLGDFDITLCALVHDKKICWLMKFQIQPWASLVQNDMNSI